MIIETNTLDGTVGAIAFIESELKKVNNICLNCSTIRQSNEIFMRTLKKAKEKAFDNINNMSKPYVVYQVNKYYFHYENLV
jgi:hypothetical protein